ncbi:hypothetical protein AB0D11_41460 [Streptomyces monashensis]|uniref:hypothetical protein n=1 Tax=Streptomyces monashensis TaxID=1678012 RepID=UPI0033CC3BBE
MLTGPDGRIRPEPEPVRATLLDIDAHMVLRWIRKTPARRNAFRELAAGTGPVTHETLDAVADSTVADHLRALLASCTQDHIDAYLTTGASARQLVRAFVHWTSGHGHTRPLTAPPARARTPPTSWPPTPAGNWPTASSRIPASLYATARQDCSCCSSPKRLHGSPAWRTRTSSTTGPLSACAWVPTPWRFRHPLDGLVRELVDHPTGKAPVLHHSPSRRLFPAALAERPLEPAGLSKRLKALGIRPRPTRNASLMDLAAGLPAYVFSRLLGFSRGPQPTGAPRPAPPMRATPPTVPAARAR